MGVIKIKLIESTYNVVLKGVFGIANPIKKSIIKTKCKVHKFINIRALTIILNDKHFPQFDFFNDYISDINEGAVWADQDFKSSNHFYNPYKNRGLYGRKSALDFASDYYSESINLWNKGKPNKSMFYLGAALHILQDMTIPQHANIRLLDNHHQYEVYVIRTHEYVKEFQVETGSYILWSIEEYVRFNARVAMKIYKKFKSIQNDEERFYRISRCTLPLAERTTAGALLMFYRDIFEIEKKKQFSY